MISKSHFQPSPQLFFKTTALSRNSYFFVPYQLVRHAGQECFASLSRFALNRSIGRLYPALLRHPPYVQQRIPWGRIVKRYCKREELGNETVSATIQDFFHEHLSIFQDFFRLFYHTIGTFSVFFDSEFRTFSSFPCPLFQEQHILLAAMPYFNFTDNTGS